MAAVSRDTDSPAQEGAPQWLIRGRERWEHLSVTGPETVFPSHSHFGDSDISSSLQTRQKTPTQKTNTEKKKAKTMFSPANHKVIKQPGLLETF